MLTGSTSVMERWKENFEELRNVERSRGECGGRSGKNQEWQTEEGREEERQVVITTYIPVEV